MRFVTREDGTRPVLDCSGERGPAHLFLALPWPVPAGARQGTEEDSRRAAAGAIRSGDPADHGGRHERPHRLEANFHARFTGGGPPPLRRTRSPTVTIL